MPAVTQDFDNCNAISTGEDTELDKAVCNEAYGMMSFTGVTKISPAAGSTGAVPLSGTITEAGRLYIFDGDAAGLGADQLLEYDLPVDYTMPENSGFVGNRKGGKKPEITIVDSEHSHYVMTVSNSRASYLLAHIEVDSRLGSGVTDSSNTGGILNLNGAGNVTMNDVRLVRRESLPNFYFSAITLGCSGAFDPTPTPAPLSLPIYTITDTTIDISAGGGFSGFAGSAFKVSGCNSSANERVQLSISGSTVI